MVIDRNDPEPAESSGTGSLAEVVLGRNTIIVSIDLSSALRLLKFDILARSTIPHFDLSHLTLWIMGSSRFWLKAADEESKSIPHELPRSHWLKATGQCLLERYLSATM